MIRRRSRSFWAGLALNQAGSPMAHCSSPIRSTTSHRAETPGRLLTLLSLLQSRPVWTGAELAGRLEVTPRTVRRDIDRLRRLGYPVNAVSGPAGGYELGVGGAMPPLLLDDNEAV